MAVGQLLGADAGNQVVEKVLDATGHGEDQLATRHVAHDPPGVRDSARQVHEVVDAGLEGLVAAPDSISPGEYEERLTLVAVDMKRRPITSRSMAEQEAECPISRCRCGEHAPTSARRRLAVASVNDESG